MRSCKFLKMLAQEYWNTPALWITIWFILPSSVSVPELSLRRKSIKHSPPASYVCCLWETVGVNRLIDALISPFFRCSISRGIKRIWLARIRFSLNLQSFSHSTTKISLSVEQNELAVQCCGITRIAEYPKKKSKLNMCATLYIVRRCVTTQSVFSIRNYSYPVPLLVVSDLFQSCWKIKNKNISTTGNSNVCFGTRSFVR